MKRWLITTGQSSHLEAVRRAVVASGGTVEDGPAIPVGSHEHVIEAEGPDDLPDLLREDPEVLKVSPDSPKHPYS